MISLYDHQSVMINGVRSKMQDHKSILLQSPTGSGKTIMALFIISSATTKNKTCFFICHRRELIDQTSKTFAKNNVDFGIVASGIEPDYSKKVQICSIDTLKNRLHLIPTPDLCLWDECQHIAANGWAKTKESFKAAYHVGLSATPIRLSGEGLDSFFDDIVLGPSVRWLIDNNFLADYRLFSVPGVDLSNAKTSMGEYNIADAETAMDKPAIIGDIVKTWEEKASDKVTIGFASSVKMSKKYVEAFNNAGYPSAHLDAKTPKTERKQILLDFAHGKYKILFNKSLFTEGFDIAANSGVDVTIGCVIDCAPTQAVSMWLQRCGRGLRKQEGKAIILDHAANAINHGLPCQDREWALESIKRKKSDREPSILVRQCSSCFACFKPAPACPECGHIQPVVERKIEHKEGELVELTDIEVEKKQVRIQQGKSKTVADLMRIPGMSEKRAEHIIKARNEKEDLQNELYYLAKVEYSKNEIFKMKPKQLRELINERK